MTTVRPAVGTSSTNATTTITIPTEPREPVTKSWILGSYVGILLVEEYVKEILACISCNWGTIQSSIGSVVSPSLFATLQSAGEGGYGVATVYPVVQAVGDAITSSAGTSVAWVKSRSRSKAMKTWMRALCKFMTKPGGRRRTVRGDT